MIFNTIDKYEIIYADPPWKYQDKGCNGNAQQHYNTMTQKDICDLPIKDIATQNSILFIWTTYPMIKEALQVIESWGFTYKTIAFQWIKQNKKGKGLFFGLGRWTRGNTEPCLLATRGKPQRISKKVFQIIQSPVRQHSRKPDEARQKIIELCGDKKRIELFAREKHEGWDTWGDHKIQEIQHNLNKNGT